MNFLKPFAALIPYKLPETGGADDQQAYIAQFYTVLMVIACFLLLPFVLHKVLMPRPRRFKLPPSPPAYPIFGHLHLLGALPHQSMAHLARKYGEIYSLRLGSVPTIVVSTPDMAREFLQTHDKIWASRSVSTKSGFYFSYNYSGIVFAPYTPVWRNLRKICMLELFTQRRMEASQGVREEETLHMIRSVLSDARQEQAVDFKLKLNEFTANVVARMLLNRRFTGEVTDSTTTDHHSDLAETREFQEIIEELFIMQGAFVIGDYIPWLRPVDLINGTEKRMKALRRRLDAFLDKILHEHEDKRRKLKPGCAIAETEKDMVDVLLNEMHSQNPIDETHRIHLNDVKSTVKNMFVGGTDTSTATMEWAMAELLRHPRCMAKLKRELDTVIGTERLVSESDIPNLPYLQAVIKETFRLHPVGPLMVPHQSTHDCEVRGYRIPAGTRLYVNIWAIGRNCEVWDRALEFDPERFMTGPEVDVKGHDFRLLPFGSGRRGCPGLPLGLLVVQCTTATLVHAFDWSLPLGELPETMDMSETFGVTVPKARTLHAIAKPRLYAHLY